MEKKLPSQNILSNVQENTPNGVISFSSALFNIKQNIYTIFVRPAHKANETKRSYVSGFGKVLIGIMIVLISSLQLNAQSFATIGTGTNSTTSTGSDPIDGYFNSFRYQVVYTAAELTAAGMPANAVVSGLGFSINGDYGGGNLNGYKINMAHTTATNCAAHNTTALTQVKTAFNYNPTVTAAGAFDMITFNTNFTWNGTSNILVDICSDGSNAYTSPYGQVRTIALSTPNGSIYVRADAVGSQCGVNTGTVNATKPQIRFAWTASAACSGTPTAGTAVTSATALACSGTTNLSVTGSSTGSGLTYQWQQSFNGGAYANITGATAATYTTASLTAAGTYVFKRIITCTSSGLSATSAASATLTLTNTLCACTAYPACSATSNADDEILNVTVGTLNNTSTCTTLAGGAGSVVAMYSNYAGIVAAPTLTQASTVSGSVTIGFCSGTAYGTGFAVYIDYNQNGSFADAGEMVYSPNATFTPAVGGTAYPFTFTVAAGATVGTTRMRIVNIEGGALPASTGTYTWGETEDYCVTIAAAAACTGTPNAGTATITSATGCPSTNFTLNSSGLSAGLGISYQWQTCATVGGTYTNVGAAGSSLTTSTATTAYYKLKTTCSGSGLVNYSNVVSYTVVACCTNTLNLYDTFGDGWNGGSVNLFVGGALVGNYTLATGLGPTTVNFTTFSGQAIQVTLAAGGTYPTEMYFNVLNGAGTPIVSNWYPNTSGTWNGTASCPAPCSGTPSPGNTLTSSASVATGGTVNLSLSTPPVGTGLTYQWQSAPTSTGAWTNIGTSAATYTATVSATTWYRCIVTCSGVTGTSTPVQVTAVVANNIPFSGSLSIPCGTSTLIYDHGGSGGDYLDNANGYIVLNNAAGSTSVISITGTYNTEGSYDFLRIYDGTGTAGTLLASYSGLSGTITPFTSAAGQTITVQFQSDGSTVYSGIALNAVYSGSCVVPVCSGTPAPGATNSTNTLVTPTQNFTLSMATPPTGSGISYVWQNSTNGTTWPAISTIINTDFASLPASTSVFGTASVAGGELILTPNAGSSTGGFVINTSPGSNINSFVSNFDYRINDGTGADGFSLSYAPTVAADAGLGEAGEGTGLVVSFDTYSTFTQSQVIVKYGGTQIFANTAGAFDLRNASYRNINVSVNESGELNVSIAGTAIVNGLALPGYTADNKSTWKFKFSARTGGAADKHSIDNLVIKMGAIAINSTYTTAESSSLYYRCIATCAASSGTSTPVFVEIKYCNPTMFASNTFSYINSVTTTGAVNNITTPVDAGFTSTVAPGVSYFASPIITHYQGGSFTLSLQAAGTGIMSYFSVWVDWNKNFTFEAGELMVNNVSCGNTATNFTIAVPLTAALGNTRMRIIDWTNGAAPGVCADLSGFYGETEDYLVSIITPLPPVVSSFSPTSICPGSIVTITGSNFYGVTGVSINGVTATYTVVSATSITATVPATTSGTIAITNTFGTGTSTGTLTINSAPATPVISVSPSATVGLGGTATLTATTTGGTINWYKPMGTLVGTGTTFTTPAACTAGTHTYYAQEAGATCPSLAASQIITVNPLLTSTPSNGIICSSGGSVTLNANVTGGTGFNWSPATGLSSTTAGITIASPTVTTAYTFTCTTTACGALSGTFNVGVIAPTSYTPTATPATLCTGATSLLASNLASAGFTYATTPFSMSTSASPVTLCSGGVQNVLLTSGNLDDGGWQNIPLGFSYNFFGSSYSSVNVGTNGVIQFGPYNPNGGFTAPYGLGDYTFANALPTSLEPMNVVAAAANDYYASVSGQIRYWTEGISPTRVFVIEWNAVPGFTTNGSMTSQIKLYETTGNVEVHIGSATSTNNKVVGLQNVDATIGATAYSSATVITNTAWKFIPGAAYGFQWSTAGAAIGGATSTTYTTPVLTTPGTNVYTVSALNPNTGCATNNTVSVTVNASPAAPISGGTVTNCSNITPQTLTATAPIGCVVDWYGAPAPFGGSNPVLLSGSATYSTSTAGTYYAVSRNTITGCTSGGTAIQYIQTPAPALPTATTAVAYCQNAIASALTATAAAGNSLNWYTSVGGSASTSAPIPSTTTAGTTNYWVAQVSGTNGCISNLLMITVTINASPAAPVAAAAGPYCQNDVAAALSATAAAGNTLQWYTVIGGTASSTAITPSTVVDGTTDYYVAQMTAAGCLSSLTTLSVLVNPTLTASVSNSASSTSACGGAAITFTAIPANGGTAPTYQWYVGGVSQPGETGITYTIASPVGGEAVYVEMVSNATPCLAAATVVSNTVTLTTTPSTPSVSIAVTGSSTICFGSPITFSVASSSSLGATPYYQWQIDGADVPGENGSTFTTVDVYPGSYVSLNVSSSILPTSCLTVVDTFSNSIYPTILDPVFISPDPSSVSACLGTTQTFTVGAFGSGTFTYQWQKDGVNITGNPTAISSTLTVSPVAAGSAGVYTCVVTGTCGAVTSAGATLTIEPNTAISAQPVAVTQCEAGLVTFTVTASGAGTLTYQWRKNGTNIVGANAATYSIPVVALTDAGNYSVVVGGTCGSVTSVNALLTVNPSITITSQPVSLTLCAGATANFSVTASGTGTLTYKWYFNGGSGSVFSFISGATSSTYSIPSITAANAGIYKCLVISGCGSVYSTTAVLTVNPVTAIVTQPVSVTPCNGSNTMFFVTATGTGTLTYQWKLDGVNIPSSNNDTLNISSVSSLNAGTYSCVVSGGTCGSSSATSTFVTLTILPNNTIALSSGVGTNNQTKCQNQVLSNITFSSTGATGATVTGLPTGVSGSWLANVVTISGTPSVSGSFPYTVTLTGGCGIITATGTITVNPLPVVAVSASATTICATDPAVTITASGASSYSWNTGASTAIISVTPLTTTTYTVTGTNSFGCTSTSTITINVNPLPAITCPSTITVAAGAGSCSAVVTYVATSTTPGAVITYSIASGSTFNVGTTSVTATATTAAGCVSTCTFNVVVTSAGLSNWIGSVSTDWFTAANWCGGVPTATTDVVIASGTTFSPEISTIGAVCKNININSGASLTMNSLGYLTVHGNWVKAGTFTATAGSVNFAGASAQTLSGATTFFDFELNNAAGLTLGGSASSIVINGEAQLNAGVITTSTNIVTVSATGYLSVTSGYVNGFLTKTIEVGTGVSQTFEVGNATTYTPITYNFNDVTTAGTLKVNTVATDHPNISGSGFDNTKTINRYWNMVKTGLVFDYYDLDVNYVTADMDAGFVQTYAGAKIRVSSTWSANSYAATYAAAHYLSFTGLTVIGALQIGVFNPVPLAYTVTPDYGYLGTTSNLVVSGNGFLSGVSSVNAMAGVTINSTTIDSDTTLTLNITVDPTATVGSRSFAITNASPFGGVSDSLTISIRPAPVANFFANRTTIGCEVSGNVEYMNYTTDAVSYLWDFGAGASPATATGFGPYTVSYSTTGLKTVQLIAFSPLGNDTVLRTNYVNVTHVAPAIPASISGPTSICSSGPNKIYSVPLVAGITNYVWTVPTGATIVSGAGTRTITVSFIPSYTTGTLTVKQENGCGESPTKSLVINGLPPAPASISGPTNICSLSSATYTVSAVVGATSYAWTLPTGVTTASGASTAATTGTTLTVYFAPGAGGYISVSSVNVCSSSPSILLLVTGTSTLVTPATLTGPTSSCGLTTGTYTVSAVAGATGYEWAFPAGVTSTLGISPVITTGTSITLTYGGVASGTISVRARNTCATSGTKTIAFTNAVAAPASVSGPTNICGISTGIYTVSAVTGATGYVWTLSAGVTSGGSSTVTTSGTSLTVDYGVGTTSGTISVAAANACVTSADATVAFTSSGGTPPATPGVISGPTAVCNMANATYSFTAVSGATSYTWTLPAGVTGGPSSTVITVDPSLYVSFAGFTAGSISVTANNCSSSAARTLALTTVPATPASITGTTVICASASQTYTVATVAGSVTDYIWTLPAGVTYGGLSGAVSIPAAISGANTITVDIDPSFTSGVLSVKAENTCGTSANRSVTLSSNPLTPGAITGPVVACGLTTATYSIAAVSGATSYTWTLPSGFTLTIGSSVYFGTISGLSNTITVDIASFTSGTLSVVANGVCGSSVAKTLAISNTTATPTNLVGSTFVCGLSTATYTATAVSGATGYTWSLPAGVSSGGVYTSVTTTGNSLPVAFDAGFTSGILSVVSNSTSCGSSLPKTITISRAPLTPATLSGSTNICNLSSATYTVSATTNAVSYTWTLPTGVTSGGLSTVTIPAVTSGSNTITVNFAAQSISGSIAVTANSACGSSAPKTLTFTGTTAPGTPTAITGSAVVCASTSGTYTATAVVGAISYTWTLPAGVTSGGVATSVTTSSTSIALDFGSTFVSGSISVKANNHCTTSAVARTLALTTVIGTAGVVTGPTVVCGLTSATYTVAATVGAVSYTWTLPAGVTSVAGASPVTIVGSNTITVDFGTFTSGSLSVKANSACASSVTARTLAISKLAATPGLISGPANVCGVTTATYSVVAVAGATGYKWTVPADLTILSGQGTNTIDVSIATGPGSTVSTSSLSVRDTNECGQSAARSLTLSNCHSYSAFSDANGDVSTIESSLYPNPSAGNFNVQYNSAINSELIIEMYDVLGKLVFSELEVVVEGENIFRYNQGDLQKGSYFIRLTDEKNNMKETKILIVQ